LIRSSTTRLSRCWASWREQSLKRRRVVHAVRTQSGTGRGSSRTRASRRWIRASPHRESCAWQARRQGIARSLARRTKARMTVEDLGPLWLSIRVALARDIGRRRARDPAGAPARAGGGFLGKGLLAGVLMLPLVLPPTVLGYYLTSGARPTRLGWGAWLERAWGVTIVFHWSGAVIASAGRGVSRCFLLPARGAFQRHRPSPGGRGTAPGPPGYVGLLRGHAAAGVARPRGGGQCLPSRVPWANFGRDAHGRGVTSPASREQRRWPSMPRSTRTTQPRALGLILSVSVVSIAALWLVQRALPAWGSRL